MGTDLHPLHRRLDEEVGWWKVDWSLFERSGLCTKPPDDLEGEAYCDAYENNATEPYELLVTRRHRLYRRRDGRLFAARTVRREVLRVILRSEALEVMRASLRAWLRTKPELSEWDRVKLKQFFLWARRVLREGHGLVVER